MPLLSRRPSAITLLLATLATTALYFYLNYSPLAELIPQKPYLRPPFAAENVVLEADVPKPHTEPAGGTTTATTTVDDVQGPSITTLPNEDHLSASIRVSHPKLRAALARLLSAPALSHKQASPSNSLACSHIVHQVNPDQLRGNLDFWMGVDAAEIERRRKEIVRALEEANRRGDLEMMMDGSPGGSKRGREGRGSNRAIRGSNSRGLVFTAGNNDTLRRLLVTLGILRKRLGCTLPAEVFSFPGELKEEDKERLKELGTITREVAGVHKVQGAWKNFQIKGEAIALSRFDEILYLDSDNIPLRDPSYLFDSPAYREHGAVFWPDINRDHPDNAIWRLLGTTCTPEHWELDSGQLLVNKHGNDGLNLAALHLAMHMSQEQDFYYKLSGGDKDTFRYAFYALGIPFKAAPRWLSSAGSMNPMDGRFCGHTMFQYDLEPYPAKVKVGSGKVDGHDKRNSSVELSRRVPLSPTSSVSGPRPLFLHANLLKHATGVRRGSTWTHVKRVKDDRAYVPFSSSIALPSLEGKTEMPNPALERAKMWVYTGVARGMCVDVDAGEGGQAVTETWEEAVGPSARGLEDWFYEEGGRAGGF